MKSSISLISNIQERCYWGNLWSTNPWYPRYPISKRSVYLMCAKSWSSQINPQYLQYPTTRRGVFQWLFGQQILGIQDIQYPRVVCAWCVKRVDRLDKSSISLISNIQDRCISENLWSTNPWYPTYPISKVRCVLDECKELMVLEKSSISSVSNILERCISGNL